MKKKSSKKKRAAKMKVKVTPVAALTPKRKIKVIKVVQFVEPDEHEITLRVGAATPPPIAPEQLPVELPIAEPWPDLTDFENTSEEKKASWSFWKWLNGEQQ
jgi:hypothetical protein